MSERGSFVTEFIYCKECFAASKKVLLKNEKYLKGVVIPMWGCSTKELPIIAGKVGAMYAGGEFDMFELEIIPQLAGSLCHAIRIAVLSETGERIFVVTPKHRKVEEK